MKYIVQPNTNETYQKSSLGGKAFHLIEMQKAKLPVPNFFVIPAETVKEILISIQLIINELVSNIDLKSNISLLNISKIIQNEILNLKFPNAIELAIKTAFLENFGIENYVAVRSSAIAEDGENASFAGQHATDLYVNLENIITKIKENIASAWGFGVLTYRLEKKIAIQHIEYAIVIQKMVAAEKSGISFSMHLQGNLADSVIVAGYGLGEGIVTDRVETDTFIINRQTKSIQKEILKKENKLIFKKEKGVINQTIEAEFQAISTLNEAEITQVFDVTMTAEQLLSCPADVEFSFDKNGQLFLLQMRPITTIDFDKIKILDNTNIVESYPEITLPLSFSFALKAYEKVFTGSSDAFWVDKKVIQKDKIVFKNLLAHYCGRVYYRLDNWYRMMGLAYSSPRSMAAWEKAVGLSNSEKETVKFSFANRLKTIFSILFLIINYKRGNRRFFEVFNENYAFMRHLEPYLDSPKALWQHYETSTERLFKPWYYTIVNDFLAFKGFGWLQDFIKKHEIGKEELANDLLCGIGGVESEAAVLNVLKLKQDILNHKDLKTLFQQSDETVLNDLQQKKHANFYQNFKHHLEKYGDRTLAELKLETPSLRKNPLLFIRLLRNQLSSPVNIADFRAKQAEIRANVETQIQAKLKWWQPKTYLFRFLRALATYGLKSRENMRFCRTRGYGAVKDIFIEIGKMMEKENVIKNYNDVFYLQTTDLQDFCQNKNRENLFLKIEKIKTEYKNYESLLLPDRVIYMDENPPILGKLDTTQFENKRYLQGTAVSKGKVTAQAAVILSPKLDTNVQGEILVSKMTDPGWVFLMTQSVGLISEKGSLLSHTAIVGRELGIPVIVGVPNVTSILKSGDLLKIDGELGIVEVLETKRITLQNDEQI
jgi:pyruvate,water dikinase